MANPSAFTHDADARNDTKMIKLRMKFGYEGYGLWWALIEILRSSSYYHIARSDLNVIAFDMRYDSEKLAAFVQYCIEIDSFKEENGYIYSPSLLRRMQAYEEAKSARSERAKLAWEQKKRQQKANAKHMHSTEGAPPTKDNSIQTNKNKDLKNNGAASDRHQFGEYVFLRPDTAKKYIKEHGKEFFQLSCKILNAWVGQQAPAPGERESKEFKERKRKAYNAAHTFNAWVFGEAKRQQNKAAMDGETRPKLKTWEGHK